MEIYLSIYHSSGEVNFDYLPWEKRGWKYGAERGGG